MLRIWKYDLPIGGDCRIVEDYVVKWLEIKKQNDILRIWALIDDEKPGVKHRIISIGTGWPLKEEVKNMKYLGTGEDWLGYICHYFVEDGE